MITWIGLCAGEIWQYLERHDNQASLEIILREVKAPKETILMAIGWLAKEGYIQIEGTLPNFDIKLNPDKMGDDRK